MIDLLSMALAVASITLTLSRASITKPLRTWLLETPGFHSEDGKLWTPPDLRKGPLAWLGKLLSCTYCTSHWVAAGVGLSWDHAFHPLRIMAVVALAAPALWLTYKAHAGIGPDK